jgi:Transposase DDE domain/Transposase domain (DUF772)
MWTPPIALSPEEQKIAIRTRKTRKFFVFLRERRHELLDAAFQNTLAATYSPEPGGKAPVEAGVLALATLLQAYGNVGDQEAVERSVMDKRWQLVLDCLDTDQPPFSQSTLFNFRMRLIQHNLDKTLLDRTVALAEQTGGFGARQLRAALDSTPLFGAGRVEDTLNLLGHALRKAVGCVAEQRAMSAEGLMEEAGLVLVGQSSLKAALDLDWGAPTARERALGLVLEEVERWKGWLAQQRLATQEPPLQEIMETISQIVAQDTEPDPEGGPGGRRIKKHVAPDRRISIEDQAMRHGRKSSSKTFNGYKEHFLLDLDSKVTREVVVCPANAAEHEAVELLAEELEKAPGLLQLDIDLGYMASPRIAQWAAQGVYIIARPWSQVGPLFTKNDFTLDFASMQVVCPQGQTVPMILGQGAQFPARACDPCPLRAQCTTAKPGHGRPLTIREDEPFQHTLRTKLRTKRGRAALRKRTAVEHAISHQLAHQGRRARYKGIRKNQFNGRRHAAVSNLQVAARYDDERRLAS